MHFFTTLAVITLALWLLLASTGDGLTRGTTVVFAVVALVLGVADLVINFKARRA